jgi:hypothetical protein
MSRILNFLAKYDDTLTIHQLKEAIKAGEISAEKIETEKINKIKQEFQNTYLKVIDEDCLFGMSLHVYEIKELIRTERDTEWDIIYYFSGNKITFNEKNIFYNVFNPERCGDSLNESELRNMVVITKEEYNKYKNKHISISQELYNLITDK